MKNCNLSYLLLYHENNPLISHGSCAIFHSSKTVKKVKFPFFVESHGKILFTECYEITEMRGLAVLV